MNKIKFLVVLFLINISCKKSAEIPEDNTVSEKNNRKIEQQAINNAELKYVLNDSFPVGDVRRYGVFPNKGIPNHPKTNKNVIETALDISEKLGIELFFPKGFYNTGLIINSRKNLNIKFDYSEFSDVIHITNELGNKSENINLKGTLITYDRFGTYECNNIKVDTLIIKSNIKKHRRNLNSRGCHIYANTTNLAINYLQIDDLGSDDVNNHAALAIDGFPNYPKNIQIKKVIVNSSERHGAYLMDFNHKIDSLIIKNYGLGNSREMSLMQGCDKGEEKKFIGVWFNECYSTSIGHLDINSTSILKNKTDVNFDIGDKNYPVLVKELKHQFSVNKNRFSGERILKIIKQ